MPSFLFIGAPRTGSTWLQENLQQHPDIFVPPCKSVLYFHPRFQIYRLKKLTRFWPLMFRGTSKQNRIWLRRFFFTPFTNDTWYNGLFPSNKISGEIAEAYCSLPNETVKKIGTMMPDTKIIFTMRNPFERALSHAKLGVVKRKNKSIGDVAASDYIRHIDHPSNVARSTYTKTLDIWQDVFPQHQIHVAFYEEFLESPSSYLRNICNFIGAKYKDEYFANTIDAHINPAGLDGIPAEVLKHTAQKYKDEIKRLHDRFGGYTNSWMNSIKPYLDDGI